MNMFEILTAVYGGIALGHDDLSRREQGGAARSEAAHRLLRWIRKAARSIAASFREHAFTRDLARLDDRMLQDIGLSRSDIPYIAHKFANADPANDNARRLAA